MSSELTWIENTKCPACKRTGLFVDIIGDITCSQNDCPNPDYNEALKADKAEADTAARVDELRNLVKTSHIELMNPTKPFSWGADTWILRVPVVPRMRIDDRIAQLTTPKENGISNE